MDYERGPGPLQGEHDKLKACIGIVEDGDLATHAIANGQYVVWKDDLYIASANIPIGTALSSSNLTAKTKGIADEIVLAQASLDAFRDIGFPAVGSVAGKTTKYLASSSASYCLILTYASSTSYMGIWMAYLRASTSTSSCFLKQVCAPGESLTLTVSTSRIMITNGYSSAINVAVIPLGGSKRSFYSLASS